MLDRRLVRDNGRGLGQGVMDNRPMNVVFHILVESNISTTLSSVSNPFPLSPSLLSHRVGAHLNYPLHAFVAKKAQDLSMQPLPRTFSPLAAPLPCDLHIVGLKVPWPWNSFFSLMAWIIMYEKYILIFYCLLMCNTSFYFYCFPNSNIFVWFFILLF